jgi:hypothetical protein
MKTITIRLETSRITDKESFHDEFVRLLGFPDFYGRNMNAWIDCMAYLKEPDADMSSIHLKEDEVLLLEITQTDEFKKRCPELFDDLIECSAFVNERHGCSLITLAFLGH